jgi:hypothetical protein
MRGRGIPYQSTVTATDCERWIVVPVPAAEIIPVAWLMLKTRTLVPLTTRR